MDDIPLRMFDSIEEVEAYADKSKREFEIAAVINCIPPWVDEICDKMLRDVGQPKSLAIMWFDEHGTPSNYEILHLLDT